MSQLNIQSFIGKLFRVAAIALVSLLASMAQAAAPGITGPNFALNAEAALISQPDGQNVYSWGYGCTPGSTPVYAPAGITTANCPSMQLPGPTLIVNQGESVSITLTNNLPAAAGNTSILFPGFNVTATPAASQPATCTSTTPAPVGVLTTEVAHGCVVTYTFTATTAGTHAYYSGTHTDLQIEMGMYGAIIVLPTSANTANCTPAGGTQNDKAKIANGETDFRLAPAAYDHSSACYDREYLFQFSEMDPRIHREVEEQVMADELKTTKCALSTGCLYVAMEPYSAAYYLINGRSMPDLMDPNYAVQYPHQPYNGNPHMHPGELTLLRVIGTGRDQHPFHEHGEHVRVLARDGNLILSQTDSSKLAGPLLFTTTTTPGQAMDGLFQWTGKGLNWDAFGHGYAGDPSVCIPDANGFYTSNPAAPNYYEWCGDHNKALEDKPFGQVGKGGPVTLPDANILANGAWYGGSPYLGPEATQRAVGSTPIPPSGTVGNDPTAEAGFAFMWHSHAEREITTNNIFPGGMMMMMLVDPRAYKIDESF